MVSERPSEFMAELASAVFRHDLLAAEQTLMLMMHAGIWTDTIIAARRAAYPLPHLESPRAEVFPKPGHLPGSTIYSPIVGDL